MSGDVPRTTQAEMDKAFDHIRRRLIEIDPAGAFIGGYSAAEEPHVWPQPMHQAYLCPCDKTLLELLRDGSFKCHRCDYTSPYPDDPSIPVMERLERIERHLIIQQDMRAEMENQLDRMEAKLNKLLPPDPPEPGDIIKRAIFADKKG